MLQQNNFFNDVTDCPVCFEKFKDPRVLRCGHYYCVTCLENIADKETSPLVVKCPNCRQITEGKVEDLALYRGIGRDIEADIASRSQSNATNFIKKPCSYCNSPGSAQFSCMECRISLCVACRPSHKFMEDLEKHIVRRITLNQFCLDHKDVVQWICTDCDVGLCSACVPKHSKHKFRDVISLAKETRTQLQRELDGYKAQEDHTEKLSYRYQVESAVCTIDENWKKRQDLLSKFESKIQGISKTLADIKLSSAEKYEAEKKGLTILLNDFLDSRSCNEKILEYMGHLVNDSSDADVCLESKVCQSYKTAQFADQERTSVLLPSVALLKDAERHLNSVMKVIQDEFIEVPLFCKPLGKLSKACQVPCHHSYIHDFLYYSKMDVLFFKRGCTPDEISIRGRISRFSVYSTAGEFVEDSKVTRFTFLDQQQDFALDCKTDRLIFPGHRRLVSCKTLASETNPHGSHFPRPDDNSIEFSGISVSADGFYILSSTESKKVWLYNPILREVVKLFKQNTDFEFPQHVHSGQYYHKGKIVSAIAVSDSKDHCVKILNMEGKLLNCYGTPGERGNDNNRLNTPRKVLLEPSGDVIVCDMGNQQIVAFSTRNDENERRILYKFDDLGERQTKYKRLEGFKKLRKDGKDKIRGPKCLSYDSKNRRLFVVDNHPYGDRLTALQEM